MLVKELIEKLQKCPQDKKVVTCQAVFGDTASIYIDLDDDVVVISESEWLDEDKANKYNLQIIN